jgi:hypothetical protein
VLRRHSTVRGTERQIRSPSRQPSQRGEPRETVRCQPGHRRFQIAELDKLSGEMALIRDFRDKIEAKLRVLKQLKP